MEVQDFAKAQVRCAIVGRPFGQDAGLQQLALISVVSLLFWSAMAVRLHELVYGAFDKVLCRHRE
eukprot:scaffold218970_cov20-Prasinocladus_malaysianus.AAC.1